MADINGGAKPFLKWVGGKGKVVPQLSALFPSEWNNYFEPFLGGGAVFFNLNHDKKSFVNDINTTLVTAYKHVRDDVESIVKLLKEIEAEYLKLDEESRKVFYYEKRAEFNATHIGETSKSALLIFLNKTCFNGLYRENSKGGFNVPHGKYKNPRICHEENLKAVSEKLKRTNVTSVHFREAVKEAKKGDFVYLDPPYHPLDDTASFTSYHKDDFTKEDQKDLRNLFDELTAKGCYVMLSNSNTDFIKDLYANYRQIEVDVARFINSKSDGRGKIKELVVVNY